MNGVLASGSLGQRQGLNSVQKLRLGIGVLVAADALFLTLLIVAVNGQIKTLTNIGKEFAPREIAAQNIKVELADMDAEAANELLVKPGQAAETKQNYDVVREHAAAALISAARNSTDSEFDSTKKIEIELGKYEAATQFAWYLHDANDTRDVKVYREAARRMQSSMFGAADGLAASDDLQLESDFGEAMHGGSTRTAAIFFGFVLLALLGWYQWDLVRRFRRIVNPGLAAATLITLGMLGYAENRLTRSTKDLYTARHDAFISLKALWNARALAFGANADESRYLLADGGKADEDAFLNKEEEIWRRLQEEQANVTFDGEAVAIAATAADWTEYLNIDKRIRNFKLQNNLPAAIALCTGKQEHESDWAFAKFDNDLMQTIKINQEAFDRSVGNGLAQLENVIRSAAIWCVLLAGFAIFGLFARMREFF